MNQELGNMDGMKPVFRRDKRTDYTMNRLKGDLIMTVTKVRKYSIPEGLHHLIFLFPFD